ncbi:septum formation initiator [Streptomyces sp. AM 2-1-1]|uniref:FtsB family cell division protein n=1 Tax=Streptomyces sp. AM 2-1-1 TaxID=3028709 RepID=UPI0023B89977|nr:septum formation initiator [Streptomyces sp. AM 2-1-1]WEH42273.1 septum formation initiator [Streptomyces sp. AM 2-1-1]
MSRPAVPRGGRAGRLARLMPSGPSNAARTPFMLLVVVLLGGGLISLLLLNSALNEGSFRLSELRKQTTDLTDEEQALQRDVDGFSQPDALERRARELGMVPGGSPAFLNPDGTVRGVPAEVTADPQPSPASSPPEEPQTSEDPAATGTAPADGTGAGAEDTSSTGSAGSTPPLAVPSAAPSPTAASPDPASPVAQGVQGARTTGTEPVAEADAEDARERAAATTTPTTPGR